MYDRPQEVVRCAATWSWRTDPRRGAPAQCGARANARGRLPVSTSLFRLRIREHATWTEGDARALAQERLDRALAAFQELGAPATGEVGDERPIQAIADVLMREPFDEIILSPLPPGMSRWLKMDLPHRVEAVYGLPVTHIIGQPSPAHGPTP